MGPDLQGNGDKGVLLLASETPGIRNQDRPARARYA